MIPISSCKDAMASRAGLFLIDHRRHSGTLLRALILHVLTGLESVISKIIGFALIVHVISAGNGVICRLTGRAMALISE